MPYNVKDFSGFVVVKIALHIIVHFGDKKQRIFIVTDPDANSLSKTRYLYIFFHEIKIAASYTFFCTIILGRYGKTQKFPHER